MPSRFAPSVDMGLRHALYMSAGEISEQELRLIFLLLYFCCCAWSRTKKSTKKLGRSSRSGADCSGRRSAQDSPHFSLLVLAAACFLCSLLLLHASAAAACFCCSMLLLLLLLQVASSSASDVASVHFANKNSIFCLFSFPIMRIAECCQFRPHFRRKFSLTRIRSRHSIGDILCYISLVCFPPHIYTVWRL